MKLTNSIEIHATPDKVFYWLGDPDHAKKWMTSVTKTEVIKETPEKVGTTFREYVEERGRGVELQGIITEFVENKKFSVHLKSNYNSTDVNFVLNPINDKTLLIQSVDMRFKGVLKLLSIFINSVLKKKILIQLHKEFLTLKKFCESSN